MALSPRLSFKGYSFGTALYRNKDTLKAIVGLLSAIQVATGFDWKTLGVSLGTALIGLVVKLLADAVDYYFSEVEL
jgi:hypothetical protein